MKCISLWQPWASAIMCGAKKIETRSWPAPDSIIGQRIGIHAAKRLVLHELDEFIDSPAWIEVFRHIEPFEGDRINIMTRMKIRCNMPRGVVLGTAIVSTALPTEQLQGDAFGDFTPGRWGWVLRDVRRFKTPIECVGRQGIFNIPDKYNSSVPFLEVGQ